LLSGTMADAGAMATVRDLYEKGLGAQARLDAS
jgi:hypothetical protein